MKGNQWLFNSPLIRPAIYFLGVLRGIGGGWGPLGSHEYTSQVVFVLPHFGRWPHKKIKVGI